MQRRTLLLGLASAPVAGVLPKTADTGTPRTDYPTSRILSDQILLWPGTAPGSEGLALSEQITERSTDPTLHDRVISGVTQPSIIPFHPHPGRANGTAVLLAPGGGYAYSAFDLEGYDIAQWLTSIGIAAYVLKYRLPAEGHQRGYDVPLEDGQRAVRLIRDHAGEWGLDAGRIGVMGFSAGGNLATTLATRPDKTVYDRVDAVDDQSARPDFVVLGYPVVTMRSGIAHSGTRQRLIGSSPTQEMIDEFSNELHVGATTPPTFLVQAHDDPVSSLNSTLYYEALRAAKVEAEMHIFRKGGHGFGVRKASGPVKLWTALADEWLTARGLVPDPPTHDIVRTVQASIHDLNGTS